MARFAFPLITRGGPSKIPAKQISSKVFYNIYIYAERISRTNTGSENIYIVNRSPRTPTYRKHLIGSILRDNGTVSSEKKMGENRGGRSEEQRRPDRFLAWINDPREVFTIHSLHLSSVSRREREKEREGRRDSALGAPRISKRPKHKPRAASVQYVLLAAPPFRPVALDPPPPPFAAFSWKRHKARPELS